MALAAAFTFKIGSEYAPDSPFELDRLVVEPDGRFEYENRARGNLVKQRRGHITGELVEAIAADLALGSFPRVPDHPTPPGSGYLTITSGDQLANMNLYEASKFGGYASLIRRLRVWMPYLRTNDDPAAAPEGLIPV